MGVLAASLHLLNFVLPALVVAGIVALVARPFQAVGRRGWLPVICNALAGVATLALGLWFFGRDGKMATYAVMVLAIATSQWIVARTGRTG